MVEKHRERIRENNDLYSGDRHSTCQNRRTLIYDESPLHELINEGSIDASTAYANEHSPYSEDNEGPNNSYSNKEPVERDGSYRDPSEVLDIKDVYLVVGFPDDDRFEIYANKESLTELKRKRPY
ncbi:hypothetical protein CXX78_01335 [Candidatus Parvarchaeota archaeon]|nr:MAG: hypothetical protein CXX78_01335 [Candidatus Parvarchaeota archaeon]